ncbi:unnamed protein product [Brassica rapa subsp. narinosa]|uniref:(rape) hypothetical protein n=1 Tax=Brassica napus TaxID=3708 RepID=A0A817AJA4_BRANA|nr:unnamed protein product [Brassica napus]
MRREFASDPSIVKETAARLDASADHCEIDPQPRSNKLQNDGFLFRQPWVFGVQEEVERLSKRVDAMAAEISELKYNLFRLNPTTP